jgi:hypothetical protein
MLAICSTILLLYLFTLTTQGVEYITKLHINNLLGFIGGIFCEYGDEPAEFLDQLCNYHC